MPGPVLKFPSDEDVFIEKLLLWYDRNQRSLPWRDNPEPYRVWISEIMLQQTQVKAVLPYFERFLEAFPTLPDLAGAREDQVLAAWSGLGYYNRARNLHRSARLVQEKFGGRFPRDLDELLVLPGIGRYTAGAILSIAHGQPYPVLDGNVRRVFSRLLRIDRELTTALLNQLWQLLDRLVNSPGARNRTADFNQALMELGALVCTPRKPQCGACPLSEDCLARMKGVQERLPVKARKRPTEQLLFLVAIIRKGDRYLLRKSTGEPFLEGFWEFPRVEGGTDRESRRRLEQSMETTLRFLHFHQPVRHQITFRKMRFHPVEAEILGKTPAGADWTWDSLVDPALPVPAFVHKIRNKLRLPDPS